MDHQQAVELHGTLAALDLVRRSPQPHAKLILHNMEAMAYILCIRRKFNLRPQQKILRRLARKLHYMGALIELCFVDSHANPADPVSRVFEHWSSKHLILETHARVRLYEVDVVHRC